jgi:hypothetical protein
VVAETYYREQIIECIITVIARDLSPSAHKFDDEFICSGLSAAYGVIAVYV